jgi:hypothetical protein
MKQSSSLLLAILGFAAVVAASCSTASTPASGTGGRTGGTGTGGTIGGTGTGGTVGGGAGVPLTPSSSGFVAVDSNTLGVVGAWFAYGDGYGAAGSPPGKCQMNGHTVCSTISAPALPAGAAGFPPTAGALCTTGMVAPVSGTPPDFGNIFGAGIGLDLNNPGGANSVKGTFAATTKGVTGISFSIDVPPTAGLRVEFPTTDTDGTTSGAAYWGATATFPNSNVVSGVNTIHWADVKVPTTATTPTFVPNNLESIQFHVPAAGTSATAPVPYSFCISNLTLLTN